MESNRNYCVKTDPNRCVLTDVGKYGILLNIKE